MNSRTILALVGSPIVGTLVYVLWMLFATSEIPGEVLPSQFVLVIAVSGLMVCGAFEVVILLPLWYFLCARLHIHRAGFIALAILAWLILFVVAPAMAGMDWRHIGGTVLSFIVPGVVLCVVFGVTIPKPANA
jgi:hypothetical protein